MARTAWRGLNLYIEQCLGTAPGYRVSGDRLVCFFMAALLLSGRPVHSRRHAAAGSLARRFWFERLMRGR